MNTIRSIASRSPHCLPARLKLVATRLGSLILLFQRMPVVQFLFPEANIIGGASVANTITLAVTTVVSLGMFDSVAGQTTVDEVKPVAVTGATLNRTTTVNGINVPATVSAALNFEFNCDSAPSSPKSWKITTGTMPAGLTMTYTTSVANNPNTLDPVDFPTYTNNFIKGTPGSTTAGIHPVQIRVYMDSGQTGDNITQLFNICVLGFSTQPASTTINSGQTTTLNCAAAGIPVATTRHSAVPVVKYEWFQGTQPSETIPVGTNSPSFTTPNLTSSTSYWVKVTSTLSAYAVSAKSSTATVNVTTPPSVTVAVAPASATEDGAGNLAYTFTRTGATTSALTANFNVTGSSTFAIDYTQTGAAGFTASSGSVTIPIGSTTATVTIDPTADSAVEPDETVTLTVATGSGYTVGSPAAATGTITNDDTPFSSWASVLPEGQRGTNQTPQGDGVTNLEKFAFNLEPLVPDVRHLTVGANGTAGLPGGVVVGGVLSIEFLRRIAGTNPGITYTAQFGSDLSGWTDIATGTPPGVAIDGTWERVTVDDPAGGPKRFGRVKVVQTP